MKSGRATRSPASPRTSGLQSNDDVANWELLVHSNKPDIISEDDLLQIGQKLRIPRGQGVVHTVLSAETLSDISDQYDASVDDILQANGLADANNLHIGDELLIPNPKRFASKVVIEAAVAAGPQIVGGGPRSDVGFIWPITGPISSYFGPNHPLGIDIDLFGRPQPADRRGEGRHRDLRRRQPLLLLRLLRRRRPRRRLADAVRAPLRHRRQRRPESGAGPAARLRRHAPVTRPARTCTSKCTRTAPSLTR